MYCAIRCSIWRASVSTLLPCVKIDPSKRLCKRSTITASLIKAQLTRRNHCFAVSPGLLQLKAKMEVDLNDVELLATVDRQVEAAIRLLEKIAADYSPATMANSLGVEDMVLTDLVIKNKLPIEIFSLDTGRLPVETYDLMQRLKRHYGLTLQFYFPRHDLVESFVRENGMNGFYESVELRKACCHARKVEPLQRALAGKKAWITGMRAEQSETRAELPLQLYDAGNGLEKFNPLAGWTEAEVWAYIKTRDVPYNRLHDKGYPSIGCAPCTRAVAPGEHVRSGRWWWEDPTGKECGLHVIPVKSVP